jgi:hypothetical protein
MPRVVRLGRPANDNARPRIRLIRALALVVLASLLAAVVVWRLI